MKKKNKIKGNSRKYGLKQGKKTKINLQFVNDVYTLGDRN
jgi:hypothetical protein